MWHEKGEETATVNKGKDLSMIIKYMNFVALVSLVSNTNYPI